jgi:predicted ArsR family transcriptional regulator
MKSTRQQILDILRHRGESTIAELAAVLDLASASVRRHLDVLMAEGLVELRSVRQPTGRPYYAFRLSERAEDLTPSGYSKLVVRLLDEVTDIGGENLRDALFERLARRIAQEYQPQIDGSDLEQRVEQVTEALNAEGILDGWSREADGYHLFNRSCPYRRAAQASHAPCVSDRKIIELLLGMEVEQVGRLVNGQMRCEYLVRAPQAEPALVKA